MPKMDKIDALLKKDCLFCGTFLIDMIDNDIERHTDFQGEEMMAMEGTNRIESELDWSYPATQDDPDWEID